MELNQFQVQYGDVKDRNKKVDLADILPFALLLMVDDPEVLLAEAKGLKEQSPKEFYKKFITYPSKDYFNAAYTLAKTAQDEMETGDFERVFKLIRLFMYKLDDEPAEFFVSKVNYTKAQKAEVLGFLDNFSSEYDSVENQNFVRFVRYYMTQWCAYDAAYRQFELDRAMNDFDLPVISFMEAMEEEKTIDEWILEHTAMPEGETDIDGEGIARLKNALEQNGLHTILFDYDEHIEEMGGAIFETLPDVNDFQIVFFQNYFSQKHHVFLSKEAIVENDRMLFVFACENNKVIARRALNEVRKEDFNGPNVSILLELVRMYELFTVTERNRHALDKFCLGNEEWRKISTQMLKDHADMLNDRSAEFNQMYKDYTYEVRRYELKYTAIENENERLKKQVFALSRELESRLMEEEGDTVLPEALFEDTYEVAEETKLLSDKEVSDKNIVIVGGRREVVVKIRERFPKWLYISADSSNPVISNNTELVVFFNLVMPHSLYYVCIDVCRNENIPVCYLKETNEDLIVQGIKMAFNRM